MRNYEMVLVIQPDLEESQRDQIFQRVMGWLPLLEGEPKVTHWGRKAMAYPINKHRDGYYTLVEANFNPAGIAELERNISFVEGVLRHLVIRKD